jgi:hypothetical protein
MAGKLSSLWWTAAVLALLLTACASWQPVPYTPTPVALSDAPEDFQRLVMTAKRWRPNRIEMHRTFASLLYYRDDVPGGVHTVTVPFTEIERIEIVTSGGEYAVRASDSDGVRIYEYVAMNQQKAQDFADVLAALSRQR